jgi:tetratricopeptide (TPR) repeat protein
MSARPPSAQSYVQLAERLTKAGNIHGAINACEMAVRLQPNHPAVHLNLAIACLNADLAERAVAGFRQAIALKPDFAHAYSGMGFALERLGKSVEAIEAFRRATSLAPKLADANERLGQLLSMRSLNTEAAQAFKRAAAAAPRTTSGRLNQARALMAEAREAEAETCLRRAIALDPASAIANWQLGNMIEKVGRFEEAQALYRRAIQLDRAMVPAYTSLFKSLKSTDAERPLLDEMQRLAGRGGIATEQRMQLLFAVGKGLEDLAEYGRAMEVFDAANRYRRQLNPFDRDTVARAFDWLSRTFTSDFISRHERHGASDDRPILILGMPRSGTTLVEQIVSSHARVAAGGELVFWSSQGAPFFSPQIADRLAAEIARIADAYRAELDRVSQDAARVTDKNPFNFMWIGLIRMVFPRARIIHCQRNPLDTCISIYTTLFGAQTNFAGDRGDLVFYFRQYERLMAHWRSVLPSGAMLEIRYEDLIADPEPHSRALIAFCGLDWDPACLHPEANRRTVDTASFWQARQPIYRSSVERWRRYEPWLGELRELLPLSTSVASG